MSLQVEDVSDPYLDEGFSYYTNIVAVTVYWNVVSCITAAFVYYFDVLSRRNNVANGTDWILGFVPPLSTSGFFLACLFFLLWPLISLAFFCNMVQFVCILLVAVAFSFFALWVHVVGHTNDQGAIYPTRKKIVFWIGYTITAPAVLMACNMIMQRRDVLYNFITVFMVVSIGISSLGSEMIWTGYEHFYIEMMKKKEAEKREMPGLEQQQTRDQSIFEYREEKNSMVKVILVVTLILVGGIATTSFPVFSSTPFSNTHSSMFVTLPVLLLLPPLVTGRIISQVPSTVEKQIGSLGQTWVVELSNIEFIARQALFLPLHKTLFACFCALTTYACQCHAGPSSRWLSCTTWLARLRWTTWWLRWPELFCEKNEVLGIQIFVHMCAGWYKLYT